MKKFVLVLFATLAVFGCDKKSKKSGTAMVDAFGECSDSVVDLHLNLGPQISSLASALNALERRTYMGYCYPNNVCHNYDLNRESDRVTYKALYVREASRIGFCSSVASAPEFDCSYDLYADEYSEEYTSYWVTSYQLKNDCSSAAELIKRIQEN